MSIVGVLSGDPFGPVGTIISDAGVIKRSLGGLFTVEGNTGQGDLTVAVAPNGRRGFNFDHPQYRMDVPISATGNEVWCHFHFAVNTWDDSWSGNNICGLYTQNYGFACQLHINQSTRHLELHRWDTEITEDATMVFETGRFYHVVWRVTVDNGTSGSCDVWIDGVQRINATSIDTWHNGSSNVPQILTLNGYRYAFLEEQRGGFFNANFGDVIVTDAAGSSPFNGSLGVRGLAVAYPEADTVDEDFTLSSGSDSYALVGKEQDADLGSWPTDYIESATAADRTMFDLPSLSELGFTALDAVVPFAIGEKRDGPGREMDLVSRIAGDVLTQQAPNASEGGEMRYRKQILETKPGGGSWSQSDYNSLEIGVDVT